MRFNPLILIRRHRLRRKLPADPIRLLGHDDAQPIPRRRERRRATAQSATNDDKVGMEFFGGNLLRSGKGRG
jgi:hypothetical protein